MSNNVWEMQRLSFAVQAAGIALWSWNVDSDKIILDDRAFDLWGVPRAPTVTFEDLSAKIHPEDLDKVRAAFAATRERLGPYEIDFRILHANEVRWVAARGKGEDQGIVGRLMYGVFIDVTGRKKAEEAREMISGEMHHRIKNLFALASSLTSISSRATSSKEEMRVDLMRRLGALAEAHGMIRPDFDDQQAARDLGDLLAVLLKPYLEVGPVDRVQISIPPLLVGERSATAIALIVHELATNSIKYGALSLPTGHLAITGEVSAEEVLINWKETDGPELNSTPKLTGFGQRMLTATVEGQLGGTMNIDWASNGLTVLLRLNRVLLGA